MTGSGGEPVRVLLVSTTVGHGSGAERVGQELLRALDRERVRLHLVAPPAGVWESVAELTGTEWTPLPVARDALVANMAAAWRIRSTLPAFDLVHAWSARAFEPAALLAAHAGVPLCGTLHDHPAAAFHGHARRWLMRAGAGRFQALVCVSEALAEACRHHHFRPAPVTIRNGLEPVPYRPRRQGIPCRIGFTGLHAQSKGWRIVKAWIEAADGRAETVWHLYGNPAAALRDDVEALARRYPRCVRVEGRRDPAEIFESIDMLVHPSTTFDSLPTALIEAGRAGIPSICTPVGGSAEIVVDGVTGALVAPSESRHGAECLMALARDPAVRAAMGRRARERFETCFQADGMVRAYSRLWETMADAARELSARLR